MSVFLPALRSSARTALSRAPKALCGFSSVGRRRPSGHVAGPAVVELAGQTGPR